MAWLLHPPHWSSGVTVISLAKEWLLPPSLWAPPKAAHTAQSGTVQMQTISRSRRGWATERRVSQNMRVSVLPLYPPQPLKVKIWMHSSTKDTNKKGPSLVQTTGQSWVTATRPSSTGTSFHSVFTWLICALGFCAPLSQAPASKGALQQAGPSACISVAQALLHMEGWTHPSPSSAVYQSCHYPHSSQVQTQETNVNPLFQPLLNESWVSYTGLLNPLKPCICLHPNAVEVQGGKLCPQPNSSPLPVPGNEAFLEYSCAPPSVHWVCSAPHTEY